MNRFVWFGNKRVSLLYSFYFTMGKPENLAGNVWIPASQQLRAEEIRV